MKIKYFLLPLFLALFSGLSANNSNEILPPSQIIQLDDNCNLPPPSSLNVDLIGSGWVNVSWPAVFGAAQYKLQVYDGQSGLPVGAAVYVPGNSTSAQLSTIGCGNTAYVGIQTVCTNHEVSSTQTLTDKFDTIILDLVVSGFSSNNGHASCQLSTSVNTSCSIPWSSTQTPFNVSYYHNNTLAYSRDFSLSVIGGGGLSNHVKLQMGANGNTGQNIYFLGQDDPTGSHFIYIYKRDNVNSDDISQMSLIATLSVAYPGANSQVGYPYLLSWNDTNGTVSQMHEAFSGPADDRLNENGHATGSMQAVAAPNPFTDQLHLNLPQTKDPNGTTIHLYDLLGARKITYEVPGDLTECTINTTQLTPGVYFLHIEADGKSQTIRVVKTQ